MHVAKAVPLSAPAPEHSDHAVCPAWQDGTRSSERAMKMEDITMLWSGHDTDRKNKSPFCASPSRVPPPALPPAIPLVHTSSRSPVCCSSPAERLRRRSPWVSALLLSLVVLYTRLICRLRKTLSAWSHATFAVMVLHVLC
jgi:hypothetical protein